MAEMTVEEIFDSLKAACDKANELSDERGKLIGMGLIHAEHELLLEENVQLQRMVSLFDALCGASAQEIEELREQIEAYKVLVRSAQRSN
jgi:hypothetical protein